MNTKKVKSALKGTKNALKICLEIGLGTALELPVKNIIPLIKDRRDYIRKPPNPIRRTLRFGGVVAGGVLLSPIMIWLGLFSYSAITLFVIGGCSCIIAGSTVYITSATLFDSMKWGYNRVDDFITLFDEAPNQLLEQAQDTDIVESHHVVLMQLKTNETNNIYKFTPYVESYIESFNQKVPYSVQIEKLQLTDEGNLLFENHADKNTIEPFGKNNAT